MGYLTASEFLGGFNILFSTIISFVIAAKCLTESVREKNNYEAPIK